MRRRADTWKPEPLLSEFDVLQVLRHRRPDGQMVQRREGEGR